MRTTITEKPRIVRITSLTVKKIEEERSLSSSSIHIVLSLLRVIPCKQGNFNDHYKASVFDNLALKVKEVIEPEMWLSEIHGEVFYDRKKLILREFMLKRFFLSFVCSETRTAVIYDDEHMLKKIEGSNFKHGKSTWDEKSIKLWKENFFKENVFKRKG